LGRAAFAAAKSGRFPLGAHGAGRFAMNSGYFGDAARVYSGQGAAFRQIGTTKIAVFIVVNALGALVDRDGNIVRCKESPCGKIGVANLGVAASEVAWDAILSSAPELDPPNTRPPARVDASVLDRHAGTYEFAPGARATIARNGDALTITATRGSLYLPANKP